MKRILFFLLCGLFYLQGIAQVPFTSYRKPTVAEEEKTQKTVNNAFRDSSEKTKQFLIAEVDKKVEDMDKVDFFDHANANIVSIQDGKKMFPTVNGEVINYKLALWTTTGADGSKRPHFLPFSIITKVSGNYTDSAAGPTNDATSFFGSPLTFRFSPAFELSKPGSTENKLFFGLHTDLRLLTIVDPDTDEVTSSWGTYGSAGLTYMGKGYAFQTDESERYDGKWSISALLYFFKSGGKFNKAVSGDYEKKTMSGIEILLRFKTNKKEDSKFNFLFGASNGFTRGAPNFAKWEFRIGVGN